MEYEIYLDMFFLVNFYMDYIIMWAVTKILKITQHVYIRRIGAAAVGALYATLIIAFRLNGAVWKIMTYAVIVLLMSFILTGKKKIRQIIGGAGLIYLFAITLGGILHVIYYYTFAGFALRGQGVSWVLVGVGGVMFAPLLQSMIKSISKRLYLGETRTVAILENKDKKIKLMALLDTGNSLYDPIFNVPVNLIESEAARKIMEDGMGMGYHLIPFASVGNESGLIPVVQFTGLTIHTSGGEFHIDKPWFALYSGRLSGKEEYNIILHPEMLHKSNKEDNNVFKSNDA